MAPAVEGDAEAVVLDRHGPGGRDEPPVQLLRIGLREAAQSRRQPAIAAVGDHRQRGVEVDVQPNLAGQAVEVEEVHADPQAILDPVAARVADDQLARRLLEVVGEEQRGTVAAQSRHGDPTDRALVATQPHRLLEVTDLRRHRLGMSITAFVHAEAGCRSRPRRMAAPRRRMVTKWIFRWLTRDSSGESTTLLSK